MHLATLRAALGQRHDRIGVAPRLDGIETATPACLPPPRDRLCANRDHWRIEIRHRNKHVILGEDGYTNRSDNAPRNIFFPAGFVLKVLKSVSDSPTRAVKHFQYDKNRAIWLLSDF